MFQTLYGMTILDVRIRGTITAGVALGDFHEVQSPLTPFHRQKPEICRHTSIRRQIIRISFNPQT